MSLFTTFNGFQAGFGVGIYKTLLYTGNGSTQSLTGVGFSPDLVWIKNRDAADFHVLTDTVRGVTKYISSNAQTIETTDTNSLTSFDTDGFSIGTQAEINTNTEDYVAWCFLERSEVFDIVSYVGDGVAGRTVSHSLGVIPEMIIVKNRNDVTDWTTYHDKLNAGVSPEDFAISLNAATGQGSSARWDNTAPTSSVFSVGDAVAVNGSGDNLIAYVFASKSGVCKIDSYSGTGSSGNAITGVGFAPNFVLIKLQNGTGNWVIYDTLRGDNLNLKSNDTSIEATLNVTLDADGFTLNNTNADTNFSGTDNYIYLAFA